MSVQERAKEAARYFEVERRQDGTEYVRVKDEAPEWVQGIVYAAHGKDGSGAPEFLPDDYRYTFTREALEYIVESDPDAANDPDYAGDMAGEFADQTDDYTSDLIAWLGSNLRRVGYCDEALEEFAGASTTPEGVVGLMRQGQYLERREVFQLVLEALGK